MNKVFKVVYSKSKGCYVVVPETAKNNNGKKKVLASVLAGLALVGAGAHMGTPVEAYRSPDGSVNTEHSRINIAANARPNNSVGVNSIVVGYQNTTDDNEGTTALGANNQAYGNSGLAVGNENYANGGAATAIGAGNEARAAATVALGNKNNANATSAVAVGNYNNQNYTKNSTSTTPKQAGNYSTAVGSYNAALGDNSVSVGSMNTSHVADTVTIGQNNEAKTMGGISIGKNNLTDSTNGGTNFGRTRDENSQIAIGRDNIATHLDTIAIGRETKSTGSGATVIGARAEASGNNSIAIGQSGENSPKVIASGVNAIAIGMQSQATGESAIAEGPGSRAGGKYGIALGRTSKANAEATTALGNDAEANIANGVALGSSSVTTTDKGVLGYNPSDPHERKYAPLTGNVQTATTAAVSIGNGQQMTRQLTGLAAGTADTDAVNVAQLKNVGVAVTGNTGKSDFLTDGGKLNVIGEGRVSTVAAHDGAKDSRITVGFDDTGMVKAGKNVTVDEKTVNGRTTYTINAADTAAKYDFLTNAKANGGKVDGTAKPATVQSGTTVNYAAGKNLTVKQDIDQSIGEQTYTYSLNSDLGGITSITNNGGTTMHFGPDNISITGGNLDLGDNNITNLKSGGNTINNAANIGDVIRISKANDKHIKPGEYAVDNNGKVTMTYVDGNNKDVPNETAVITGIAKQDLSNINNGGKTVIKNLAKEAIDMENGKNTTASHRDVNGVKTFKVDVEGDLTDITSITNKDGDGKIAFGGNQTVNVAGDHNINLNAKVGDITGLTNVTLDAPDFAKKGRAATEEQLNIVNNKFNNTVGLNGNTGATELQKLNKQGGLSFGVVGANNGEYIKTTASGSDVVADLSDSAKNKLNSTVEVQGKNAAKVTSNVVQNADGSTKTIYTVDVNNVTPTAASTEKVQAKADVAGSSDKNIAKVSPKAGDQFGEAGATYEVNVSRNDVKDTAREAVTVNNANNNNNPITVTPVQDEANHNTTYQVTFDGDKAAKQIPLTYKANGTNEQKVTLDKGLNFTNGKNTTASVDAEGVVKYDVNKDLVDIHSISNTTNGPKMEFGPNSINITGGPINMGDQNITNLKSGGDVLNNAANIGDVTRISKANDLHIAPTSSDRQGETTTSYAYDAASKSVTLKYNDGNGANQAGTVAKIDLSGLADQIKDGYSFSTDAKGNVVGNHAVTAVGNGKTVSYAAGDNVTVKQDIDAQTGEHTYTYALSNNIDLTPNGSLKIGDTILNNGGLTITGGPSVTKTGINAGNLNITNVKAGVNDTDAVNVKQLKDARTVVTSNDNSVTVNKTENGNQVTYDLHVAPGAAQSVWNVKSTGNTTADSEATAKTITDGKTVEMAAGKNLTVKQTSNNDGAKVEYALSDDIKIGNDGKDGKDGVDGKIGVNGKDGSSVVINGKDGSIGLNGKDGKDGLTMKAENGQPGVNGKDGITRIVYEDKNNNKHEVATLDDGLKFTGNNTDTVNNHKLNSLVKVQGEGVDKTTSASFKSAAGNINVKADGTDTLEVQLNKDLKNINTIKNDGNATFTIGGDNFAFNGGNVSLGGNNITNLKSGIVNNNDTDNTNAANIGDVKRISKANDIHIKDKTYTVNADKTVTLEYVDGNDNAVNKTAKIDLSNLPTGDKAAVESVVKKSAAAGDTNIADITVADGKQTGDANAKYEVNVSRNAVKDAAREAVTVNNANNSNNPITVTPVQDETNHNTTYQVTFDGDKAAKQIPLTYKANGSNDQKVTLDKGLNFTNGSNTTASVAADGVVKYDLNNNVNLTPSGSLTVGDTVVNNGGLTISGGPSVLKTGINAGNLNITNVKAGVNDTDAVNVKQLKDSRTVVTSNDNSVTVNKTENGNQVTYDLHVAPGAAQSVWNVKSTGNTTADSETTAKTISDGKTVEMAAGKNLTVKQTSNNDGAKVEFDLANDIKIGNDGKDGKDGVDGKIGVNGKDGSAVVINGKDGSIGLNGKDGKDGLTIRGANGQDGVNGTNGTNGITRIVYEDKNNNKHEVATTDDGLKFTGNNTDVVNKNKLNSLVKVQGEGVDKTTSASFKSASGNINVKADGTDTLEVQLNKDLKNITSIKNDGPATFTIGGNEFKFDGGNVNMGGNNITNLKSGGDVLDNAANIGDVKRISKANDLHIAPTQSDRTGETTTSYSYDAADKSVTLKYNDGNGANQAGTIAKIDLSGLADQIKDGFTFKANATANGGKVEGTATATTVENGGTINYAAGKNLTVEQTIDPATKDHTYTYALTDDIKLGHDGKDGKPGKDGSIGVNGKDGSAVVINGKDGSIGLNGKDGKDGLTIKGANGQDGVDGKNGTNGITRIVYEDKNNNKHEVATTDDGMKYAGDDGQTDSTKVIAKKLNQTLDITGGANSTKLTENNIGVNNVDGKLKVQLAQKINLTPNGSLTIGDTVVNNGGLTINNGPSITKGGINAGGLNITNVKAGVNDTDAVNVKQLKSAKTEVEAGDNVTVTSREGDNGQTIYKVSATGVNLGDAELNYTANNGAKQKVKLSEGLNFVDGNYTKASVDANGVVKYDVTLGKVKDGVDGKPGVDGDNGIATVKTVVDTINNSGWKGDVTGNTVGDHTATIVKPGTTVNFGAGKNLTVEQIVDKVTGNHTYNYALSDDIKVGNDGKDGKPGVDGKIGVNGKDGSAVVINGKDGSIGLNGKDGKDGLTIRGANGQDGVNGTNGTNGITRIVYEDSNNNKHEVATTDDGLKFTGNNESVVNKNKLNSTVKVKGEGVTEEQEKTFESAAGNIAVTADGNDTLNIRLNKNIKGIDSIQTKEIRLGTPDNYTTIKKDGDRIKYGDKTFANTDDIWTIQANGTDVPANGGKVNVKGTDGITVSKSANGEMTISGAGLGTMNSFNVKSSGNTTADSETTAKSITDGKTVEFSGGKNLTVKQTSDENGAKVEYALSNNVDLTNKGSLTVGDTKITDGGLVINNGPSVTKDGINAGNKQITNVEDGVNDTDAVNVRQLKAAKTNLVDGQNTKVTGDGSKANPYKVNVEGDLNKITSITNNEGDGKLEFKGDQVVNVAGDNTIKLDGKTGDITGLTNKTLDSADFATKGRAATEEQLKLVQEEAAKKSTEKVQAKADANNIAKVAPKAGDTFGAAGATYEVSVDKNDVKDAAREAVTVTGDNKAITVDVQPNATNHTTNYQVNFNGKEAAKQIPLTYKENGGNAKTVMLSEGLDFSNGVNTTAHTGANGKVSFDVKGDLTNITSISNNSNGPKVSFGGDTVNITGGNLNMGGNKITNVQRGTNDTDAVNVKQLKDSRTTLTSDDQSVVLKKTETADGGLNYDLSVKGAVDPRVDQLNEEIGRVGAQGAALSALKPMQYDPLEPTQIMAGYGNYRGNSAIAVGVAHYKNESTMFHGGLSWAGGSSHMMANAGVTWKVGNRDAEAAVADRYRKGPISSAYAVQTEMAAMKAQNAGLKGEVSDLKYENEQIKAQNAGLQSEVEVLKAQMAAMMAKMGM